MPVPVQLWMPDQDWFESTGMMVGQSERPEAAEVCELNQKQVGHVQTESVQTSF